MDEQKVNTHRRTKDHELENLRREEQKPKTHVPLKKEKKKERKKNHGPKLK